MRRRRLTSFYWRIALGFMLCVAVMLAIQGAVLLWMMANADPDSRTNFTLRVANDIATAMVDNPALDIDAFVRSRYATPPRSFYVVMTDATVVMIGREQPSAAAVANVIREFRAEGLTAIPRNWEIAPYWAAPILIDGVVKGTVAVVPQNLVREIGPTMAILAVTLFIAGTLLTARFIFAPAHRRLKALEEAAMQLGAGQLDTRARVEGADEIASLAMAFNQMASALAAHAERVAASDRTRRLLLADVSHELMTPLTAIRGYQERLSLHPRIRSTSELAHDVSVIGEETLRVERMARDLLDLARLEGGGADLEMEDVSTEGLLGRVATRHEAEAISRQITLTTRVESGAEVVIGDAFRLEQALQNLAANAIRHVPPGGAVTIEARLVDSNIVFTVRDSGAGIDDEHLPFIFDRFYKADPSRSATETGSGLGLSIVKAIIERHGGTVSVSSTPGVETLFTIQVPASAAA
jgi:two-component system, OmpR family, sensor kinase